MCSKWWSGCAITPRSSTTAGLLRKAAWRSCAADRKHWKTFSSARWARTGSTASSTGWGNADAASHAIRAIAEHAAAQRARPSRRRGIFGGHHAVLLRYFRVPRILDDAAVFEPESGGPACADCFRDPAADDGLLADWAGDYGELRGGHRSAET